MSVQNLKFYVQHEREQRAVVLAPLELQTIAYRCGGCSRDTVNRIIATASLHPEGHLICWCYCGCGQPTCMKLTSEGAMIEQYPSAKEFQAENTWPKDITSLFVEAAACFTANAYTATSMLCRKMLMVCAVEKGQPDGLTFQKYVDYIANNLLVMASAKNAVDAIRQIGNDANHDVAFVDHDDAKRSMRITHTILETIYTFPSL